MRDMSGIGRSEIRWVKRKNKKAKKYPKREKMCA
jgi:hypothetical protein